MDLLQFCFCGCFRVICIIDDKGPAMPAGGLQHLDAQEINTSERGELPINLSSYSQSSAQIYVQGTVMCFKIKVSAG